MKKLLFGLVFLASVSSFAKGYECTNKELANITAITAVMEMIKDKEPKNAAKADVMLNVITQGLKTLANESADEAPTNDESLKRNIFCGIVESNSKQVADFFAELVREGNR